MAGRAARRNIGGGTWYSGGSSNVASEAKERKEGGAVAKKKAGGAVKRASGGRTQGKHSGFLAGGRLDKRARGGGIRKLATGGGADQRPFSSAAQSGDKGKASQIHGTRLGRATGGGVKKK